MYGLKPKSEDVRDLTLGAAYTLPKLSELPKQFNLGNLGIMNQADKSFCTGFATAGMSALQEGVKLVPEFAFATIGKVLGYISITGYEMRDAMKGGAKIGFLEEKDRPEGMSVNTQTAEFLADVNNWGDYEEKALTHKKKAYVSVEGPYDHFDNIRAAIWLFRNEKRGIALGVRWGWATDKPFINTIANGYGHMIYATGWDSEYLIVPNSWGEGVGDKGVFYIHRKVINAFVDTFGSYMFVDHTKEEIEKLIEDRKNNLTIIGRIIEAIVKLIPIFGQLIQKKTIEPPELIKEPMINQTNLTKFAEAIKRHEGWFKGSRSFRNNNPGNMKFTALTQELGATSKDLQNFAIFPSAAIGFEALKSFVLLASENKLKSYKNCNILTFCEIYAPSFDNNDSLAYARVLARALNTTINEKLYDIFHTVVS